jgi:hypothetical protein
MRQIPLDPSIPRHCLSRLKTPVQTKETQSKAHHVQDSDRNSNLAPRNLSSNSLNSEGADSVDDLVHVMLMLHSSVDFLIVVPDQ